MWITHTFCGRNESNQLIQVRSGASVAMRMPLTNATPKAATSSQCRMIVP